jgi:archaeosine synthase beta-subunit
MHQTTAYPTTAADRNRWILSHRGPKNALDPARPYAFLHEEEIGANGELLPTATLFLTNRECPYRCLFCDLWQNTLDTPVPLGAIPAQIEFALAQLLPARQIKLYNAGSFFDPQAIPPEDDLPIAALVSGFERVIVECHPALIGKRALAFRDLLPKSKLEIAIGLETAHPTVLDRLNKRITLDSFRRAADFLAENAIDLRVFLLVRPPFLSEEEGLEWACRSLDLAFDCGATACTLIPTRAGNGALEALAATGHYAPPSLRSLEAAQEYGLRTANQSHRMTPQCRVFADTWDVEKFYTCACSPARARRLDAMNLTQRIPRPVACDECTAP